MSRVAWAQYRFRGQPVPRFRGHHTYLLLVGTDKSKRFRGHHTYLLLVGTDKSKLKIWQELRG